MLVLQHVRIFSDFLTSGEVFTFLYVFQIEESLMFPTHMISPEVDRRAICRRRVHDVDHNLGYVYFFSPWECLPHFFFVVVLCDSGGVIFFLFFEEGSNSILSPELLPGIS